MRCCTTWARCAARGGCWPGSAPSAGWPRQDAAALETALGRLAALQQVGRLASDHTIDPAEGGEGLVRLVLAVTGQPDLDTLRRRLAAEAARSAAIIAARLARR